MADGAAHRVTYSSLDETIDRPNYGETEAPIDTATDDSPDETTGETTSEATSGATDKATGEVTDKPTDTATEKSTGGAMEPSASHCHKTEASLRKRERLESCV